MAKIMKSDLTYSLSGGFVLGALALFLMQPAQGDSTLQQTIAATLQAAGQFFA